MSRPADAFDSELDYLWRAVGEAQDASLRSEQERAEARKGLALAASRAASLERQLAEAQARERRLRRELEGLRAAAQKGAEELGRAAGAARQAEELRARVLRADAERGAAAAEIDGLKAEAAALREALASRDAAMEALKARVEGALALPEIARALERDAAVSGKTRAAYDELFERLEQARRAAETAAAGAAEEASRRETAAQALQEAERGLGEARAALHAREEELASLQAGLAAAAEKEKISMGERASLEGRAAALKAALAEKITALETAQADAGSLRALLDAARTESERLRQAAAENAQRTEEQRANFTGAVAQVFELQKKAAALRAALAEAQEKGAALAAELKGRAEDLDRVNGLLRDSKNALAQEKEISKRAQLKIKAMEAEMDGFRSRLAAASDYSARVLKSVEERDLALGAAKAALDQEARKNAELSAENEDLRRKNVRFTGLLKREQAEFTARMLAGLEKTARDLKNFNLRIPAAERKALEPSLKNLLASVNLLKGWREYLDPEAPELQDTDLAAFVSGETGKWERAFKQRKLSVAAAVLNPRLRARLDPERVKMLFYNVIKNAYERLQPGGSLRVTLKGSEDGRSAVLTFEDSGPGFAQEALDRLYAPFNTTDKGKAGIGLAVARRIAEKHGGTLSVANRKERGAVVEVRLPLGMEGPQP